jgi:hypothetical protein
MTSVLFLLQWKQQGICWNRTKEEEAQYITIVSSAHTAAQLCNTID